MIMIAIYIYIYISIYIYIYIYICSGHPTSSSRRARPESLASGLGSVWAALLV